jgi:hypothetical protein
MSPQSEPPLVDLARKLTELTDDGKISWKFTDRSDSFQYSGHNASVAIRSVGRNGSPPFVMTLYNEKGDVVDIVRGGLDPESGYEPMWSEEVEDLFLAARRSAYDVGEVVERLLTEIEPEEPPS